jgi:type II secretory pathway pseudopilin PulG
VPKPQPQTVISSSQGFSLIEALIGAALISVIALGLGSSLHYLQHSREKSQSTSLAVETESALINAIQDPANYGSIAGILKSGETPPNNFQLKVTLDPSSGQGFSISPGQQIYLTENLHGCESFKDSNCVMMVALSPWGKDKPLPGMYSFAYSIQTNPSVAVQPALGSPSTTFAATDYILTVPSLSNNEKVVQCGANAVGLLGVDATGQALCLYYSGSTAECPENSLPKGFVVTPDPSDTHRYYLNYKCVPMRQIACAQPNYSFQSLNPSALDSSISPSGAAGLCVYIGAPTSSAVTVNGSDGMSINQACPSAYVTAPAPSCVINGPVKGSDVTCGTGQVLTANTSGVKTQVTASGSSVTCRAVIPQQQCCSDNTSKCTSVTVPLTASYSCILDASHQPITVN